MAPTSKDRVSEAVRGRLRGAGSRELGALVAEHGRRFGLREVRQVLLNPFVGAEVIEELSAHRDLVSEYGVKAALARHHRTSQAVALRLVPSLFWRDLLEIALDVRLRPIVRRSAEKYLVERLPRLAVGERIALARRAPASIAARLGLDPNLRVVEALLDDPKLTERALLGLVENREASPRTLDLVARHERWGVRPALRAALARNPRSPFRVLFEILPTLAPEDLEAVARVEEHAELVRSRAEELLAARATSARGVIEEISIDETGSIEEWG